MLRHRFLKKSADTTDLRRGVRGKKSIFKDLFLNHEVQHAKNTFENRLSITLKIVPFGGFSSPLNVKHFVIGESHLTISEVSIREEHQRL